MRVALTIVLLLLLAGCGYTVVRDLEEEERQAELAAIDSLKVAPDLTITDVQYQYHQAPPATRSSNDQAVFALSVQVTIANIGNEDFHNPFVLLVYSQPQAISAPRSCVGIITLADTIPAKGTKKFSSWLTTYSHFLANYDFLIVTNPKIQRDIGNAKYEFTGQSHRRLVVPITRELRYDNNAYQIAVPGLPQEPHYIRVY